MADTARSPRSGRVDDTARSRRSGRSEGPGAAEPPAGAAGPGARDRDAAVAPGAQTATGRRLAPELPETGPGAPGGFGRRAAAFVLDAAASWLVATLITRGPVTGVWSTAVLGIEYVVLLTIAGQSFGMRLLGLRVARTAGGRPGPVAALVRTVLLLLLVPALVFDRIGRGLHDLAAGTVVVRTR